MKLATPILQSIAKTLAKHPKFLFIGALLYVLSPIDLLPEAFLGPFGFLDDLVMLLLPFLIREYGQKSFPKRPPPTPDVVETTRD